MAINDVYKVTLLWNVAGNSGFVSSGFHYRQDGIGAASITDVGDEHKAWWDAIKEHFPTNCSLDQITLRRIEPLEPLEQLYTTGLPDAGTSAGGAVTAQVATLISLRTGNIGRSYRGRAYLPAMSESEYDTSVIIPSATASDIANETENLFAAMNALGTLYQAVVWSPTLSVATDITLVQVDTRGRTQRRRMNVDPVYVT